MSDYFNLPKSVPAAFVDKEVTVRGLKVGVILDLEEYNSMSEDEKTDLRSVVKMLQLSQSVLTESTFLKTGKNLLTESEFRKMEIEDVTLLFSGLMAAKSKHEEAKAVKK